MTQTKHQIKRDQKFRDQPSLTDTDRPGLVDHGARARNAQFQRIVKTAPVMCQQWLARIIAHGPSGCTLDQLSVESDTPANVFSGRITELVNDHRSVVRTSDRRTTRAGGKASVIVARCYLPPDDSQPSLIDSGPADDGPRLELGGDMPDAMTQSTTPVDQHGDPIRRGCFYMLTLPKRKSVKARVEDDPESGRQFVCVKGIDRMTAVDEMTPDAMWERIG